MNLDPLPPSTDEYWEEADTEVQKDIKIKPCDHEFVHRTSLEVECRECKIGYFLDPQSEVIDGHIYHKGKLVI